MFVEFIVRVVAEIPDDTPIDGLCFGDKFGIINTSVNSEIVDYSTESVEEQKEE